MDSFWLTSKVLHCNEIFAGDSIDSQPPRLFHLIGKVMHVGLFLKCRPQFIRYIHFATGWAQWHICLKSQHSEEAQQKVRSTRSFLATQQVGIQPELPDMLSPTKIK